jgi:hypothetical protein
VNTREEKSLKNLPHYTRNDVAHTVTYENPPVFVNFQILVTATHANYSDALLMLSRAIRFFQHRFVFTPGTVAPESITTGQPKNPMDQLTDFKLIFDLCSPSLEEVNHMWGTLGGKQYPFVLYMMRLLDLRFAAAGREEKSIGEIVRDIHVKDAVI